MREKFLSTICLILLLVAFSASAEAEEVRISAAASLTEAVKEIVSQYQKDHAEKNLLANFAASGALAKQISAGAPTDIYISANPKWMLYLQQQGVIAELSKQVLVQNSLVFVGMTAVDKLADLPRLKRIAIGSPKSTPAGRYAEQAMTSAGIYVQLQQQRKLILGKDVRQALLYADRGEVDGAFVYRTDALLARQVRILFVVPQQLYPAIVYPAALTITGEENPGAKKVFDYLFSPPAQAVFRKFGFVINT
jgi:molybdate transport system substrate-binding protein